VDSLGTILNHMDVRISEINAKINFLIQLVQGGLDQATFKGNVPIAPFTPPAQKEKSALVDSHGKSLSEASNISVIEDGDAPLLDASLKNPAKFFAIDTGKGGVIVLVVPEQMHWAKRDKVVVCGSTGEETGGEKIDFNLDPKMLNKLVPIGEQVTAALNWWFKGPESKLTPGGHLSQIPLDKVRQATKGLNIQEPLV
jgi:hypothetical protein